MKKIGISVAMEEELLPALGVFGEEVGRETYCGKPVYKFSAGDKEIYAVNSGVGEIAAAATAQMLIDRYGVAVIINFGFAGALKHSFKLGELIVADGVAHYDFDITALEGGRRAKYSELESVIIPVTDKLAAMAAEIGGLKRAIIASGDKVIADKAVSKVLVEEFDAGICEMESAGIALTALRNGGVHTLFIKLVSDGADDNMAADFGRAIKEGTEKCGKLIAEIIKKL